MAASQGRAMLGFVPHPNLRTVDLGATFQRIGGTGQDPVNDGADVTQLTLPAYDGIVLVRP